MREWLVAISMVAGSLFMFLAALGLVRMPDFFLRAQVATKAYTAGLGGLMTAAAIHFGTTPVVTRAALVVLFVFLTAPVAAHLLGRSAYFMGIPLWRRMQCDELRGRYDPHTHALSGGGDGSSFPPAEDRLQDRGSGPVTPDSGESPSPRQ